MLRTLCRSFGRPRRFALCPPSSAARIAAAVGAVAALTCCLAGCADSTHSELPLTDVAELAATGQADDALEADDVLEAEDAAPDETALGFTPSRTVADGIYTLAFSSNNAMALGMVAASAAEGSEAECQAVSGSSNQLFRVSYTGEGYYTIVAVSSYLALTVEAQDDGDAYAVQQELAGADEQLWAIEDNGDGTYGIVSKSTGLYLGAANGLSDGASVQLASLQSDAPLVDQGFAFVQADMLTTALSTLTAAESSDALAAFGGASLSAESANAVSDAVAGLQESGASTVGFMLLDLTTGEGLAYNADWVGYSASTIKGPYIASLCRYDASSVAAFGTAMTSAISVSDNDSYLMLCSIYGTDAQSALLASAGVTEEEFGQEYNYAYYSARTLAKLWTSMYAYFISGEENAEFCANLFLDTQHSTLSTVLGSKYTVYSKAGWMDPTSDLRGLNDAGVVVNDGHAYVLAVMSDGDSSDSEAMQELVAALDEAHSDLIGA